MTKGQAELQGSCSVYLKCPFRDLPGGPVVKTPQFLSTRCRFDPWSGSYKIPYAMGVPPKNKSTFNTF